MKVDLIRKYKWYIVGFILVAIMLSVSLSFCAWDTLSLQAKLESSGSGVYSDHVKLVDDKNKNGLADIGDIVTFGNYYQAADTSEASKTPIRWIIVEKEGTKLTLLAEKVIAFGNFWGNFYNDGTSTVYYKDWGPGWYWANEVSIDHYYQNYSQSTIRAWLNSNYTLRNDAGEPFSAGNTAPRFRGFMSEAFDATEQNIIVPKTISGMRGYPKDSGANRNEEYASITDKVWIPSWSEVYGTTDTSAYAHPHDYNWATPVGGDWNTFDGTNARFSYFNGIQYNQPNPILNGYTTAYASSQYSNYTVLGATSSPNMQSLAAGGNVWWWLRSPMPSYYSDALVVDCGGSGRSASAVLSHGGVRPAVCVKI